MVLLELAAQELERLVHVAEERVRAREVVVDVRRRDDVTQRGARLFRLARTRALAREQDGHEVVVVGGVRYYTYAGVYYRPYYRNGATVYVSVRL